MLFYASGTVGGMLNLMHGYRMVNGLSRISQGSFQTVGPKPTSLQVLIGVYYREIEINNLL